MSIWFETDWDRLRRDLRRHLSAGDEASAILRVDTPVFLPLIDGDLIRCRIVMAALMASTTDGEGGYRTVRSAGFPRLQNEKQVAIRVFNDAATAAANGDWHLGVGRCGRIARWARGLSFASTYALMGACIYGPDAETGNWPLEEILD